MKRSSGVPSMYKGGLVIKGSPRNRQKSKPVKCPQCYRMMMVDGKCTRCRYEVNPKRMMMI